MPVPVGGWPEAVRFHPARNALVMLSTAPAGAVEACQVVRLTPEAKKRDPFKRTHGRKAGATARLPGGDPAAKLVLLAEGPEVLLTECSARSPAVRSPISRRAASSACARSSIRRFLVEGEVNLPQSWNRGLPAAMASIAAPAGSRIFGQDQRLIERVALRPAPEAWRRPIKDDTVESFHHIS